MVKKIKACCGTSISINRRPHDAVSDQPEPEGYLAYTETLSLEAALWWYIENEEATPEFTAVYFRLRERSREEQS